MNKQRGQGEIVFFIGMAFCIGLFVLAMWALMDSAKRWEEFKSQHNCKIVGKIDGDVVVGTGIGANGQMTTVVGSTAGKTGYLCDDGVTYWK